MSNAPTKRDINASLKFNMPDPTDYSCTFDSFARHFAHYPASYRAEPGHVEAKKIVIDTKERLRHPYMCTHPMVYNNRSKLIKTCDCENRPRKMQINFRQRCPYRDEDGTATDTIGDIGSVLTGVKRHDTGHEYRTLKRAMNGLIQYVMMYSGFEDGRPNSTPQIQIPDNHAIKLIKASLIQFGKPACWWTNVLPSNIRYWDRQLIKTLGNGNLTRGMYEVHEALVSLFFRKPNPLFEIPEKMRFEVGAQTQANESVAIVSTEKKGGNNGKFNENAIANSSPKKKPMGPAQGTTDVCKSNIFTASMSSPTSASSIPDPTPNSCDQPESYTSSKSRLRFAQAVANSVNQGALIREQKVKKEKVKKIKVKVTGKRMPPWRKFQSDKKQKNSPQHRNNVSSTHNSLTSALQQERQHIARLKIRAEAEAVFLRSLKLVTGRPIGFGGMQSQAALPADSWKGFFG